MNKPQYLSLVAIWQLFCAITSFLGILGVTLFMILAVNGFINYGGMYLDPFTGSIVGIPGIFTLFAGIGLVILLAYFIISLAAGIGTLQGKRWARTLGMIQAVFGITNVPIGTVAGVLTIIYLGKSEVVEYFDRPLPPDNQQAILSPSAAA